jgi:hypothetical protein
MERLAMQQISFWSMFVRPLSTLDSLRERPRWVYPVLISGIISVASSFYVIQRIGLPRMIESSIDAKSAIDPQAILQNALEHQVQILCFQALSTFIGSFLMALGTATILWFLLTLCGYDMSFKQGFAVVAHVNLLAVVLRECMMVLTASLVQDMHRWDLNNPLATNIAFFVQTASPAVSRLLNSFDAITFTSMALLIVGLTKVCGKLSVKTASLMVIGPWAVYLGAAITIKAFMS